MRTNLISLRGVKTTPDLAEGIRLLEKRLVKVGNVRLKISFSGTTTMSEAGREVSLTLVSEKYSEKECIFLLWGNAIPCGFTPLDRYPNLHTGTHAVFHFFGEWQTYFDGLLSNGQGEFAWESLCTATCLDVGRGVNDSAVEVRYIQAQLARLGVYSGLIDGNLSQPVQSALGVLGLQKYSNKEIIKYLNEKSGTPPRKNSERTFGFITMPSVPFRAYSYGNISTTQKKQGVEMAIEGAGRVVIDISSAN